MSITVKFLSYELIGGHCEYLLQVTGSEGVWQFKSRYSAIRDFHELIRGLAGSKAPVFPPKKLFGNLKPSFLEERRGQLERYFQELLAVPEVSNNPALMRFLSPNNRVMTSRPVVPKPASPVAKPKKNKVDMNRDLERVYTALVDEVISKYIDLSSKANPIEEEDVVKKQHEYKALVQQKKYKWENQVPRGSDSNFEHLRSKVPNLSQWADNKISELERAMSEVKLPQLQLIKDLN